MNEEPKKLNKYYILVLVLILVIGLLTATYAFFQIDTDDSTANTTITANTDCFNITFEDISEEGVNNLDINYPIKDEYAIGKTEDTENLKPVIVKISNKCTQIQDNLNYKLAITTLAKEPENDQDKGYIPDTKVRYNVDKAMNEEAKSALSGPAYLNSLTKIEDDNIISLLKEEITKKEININDYNTVNTYIIDSNSLASNNTSTYYIKLWIDYYEGDSEAYTNPEGHEDRTYTCGDNQCKYDNSTEGQKFASVISLIADGTTSARPEPLKSTVDILREKDSSGTLSTDLQGGMYRYQAAPADESEAAQMTNWICFGTKSKDDCTNPETGIDKYMYRIIGITDEGQLYLIKETFLKEGTQKTFVWNDKYSVDSTNQYYCDDGLCPEWNTSLLFKRINGTSNGTETGSGSTLNKEWTDIFVDNSEYEYLKSGDENGTNDEIGSDWYNLIANHEWMYGDTTSGSYNGDTLYDIETGQTETTHYVGTKDNITQQTYTWSNKVKAKIGLMYLHDVAYAYYDGSQDSTRGNPGSYTNVKNSWIHFQKDGYQTDQYYEWLSTRWGVRSTSGTNVFARRVYNSGTLNDGINLYGGGGVRPVFYLESSAKIASGDGTKANPYILE